MACPMEDTLTTRAGADVLSAGSSSIVKTKWPTWLVPNCISMPSAVSSNGVAITPVGQGGQGDTGGKGGKGGTGGKDGKDGKGERKEREGREGQKGRG